jgi:glycerol-3-phosphate dehydrogenase
MAFPAAGTADVAPAPSVKDRVVDACRQGAHFSHEVRLAKSIAADAIEDGIHVARRAAVTSVRRGVEQLEDLRDEAAHRIKRAPLASAAVLVGAGLLLGAALGYLSGHSSARRNLE